MACPTCDHTMQRIDTEAFWCTRCGTVKVGDVGETYVPKLVPRVLELANKLTEHEPLIEEFHRLGVAESITKSVTNESNEREPFDFCPRHPNQQEPCGECHR